MGANSAKDRRFDRVRRWMLLAVIIVSLLGCSSHGLAAKTRLIIWWPQGSTEKAVLQAAIADYAKVNPSVEIVPQWQPDSDDTQKLKIAYVGGNAPDIVRIDHVWVQALGYKRMFTDLVPYGANSVKNMFFDPTWQANTYKDKVFALPFDANVICLMYNNTLLKSTGTTVPTTYDELIAVGKANTRDINNDGKIDKWGYTIPVSAGGSGWLQFQWLTWLWRMGGEVLNDDWNRAVFNSPEGVKSLEMMIDVVKKHKIAPDGAYYEGDFYNGNVAMIDMGPWSMSGRDPKVFGFAPLPVLNPRVGEATGLGLYSLAITSSCKNPKAAYDFVKFVTTTPKYSAMWSKGTYLMPSLKTAYSDPLYRTGYWSVFMSQLPKAKMRPGTPAWPEIAGYISDAIQSVLAEKATAAEALNKAAELSNKALSKVK